jgi:hypothetical protein
MLNSIHSKATNALLWGMRITSALIIVTILLSMAAPVFADSGSGSLGDGGLGDVGQVTNVFRKLSETFINIILTLMVLVFAVGMVRSGFSMQAAQALGLAGKVSNEVANMVGGILVFVLGMLTMAIVRLVISQLNSAISVNTDLSDLRVPGT